MINTTRVVKTYCGVCGYLITSKWGLCLYCFQHNPLKGDRFSEAARRARRLLEQPKVIESPGRGCEDVDVDPSYL